MDHYKRMVIFTKVVEQGSMSAAGRLLDMSPSAISQQIRYLENHSGITLLHRSTRKLTLTDVGKRYYYYCQQLCQAADNAQAVLESEIEEPFGELRIAAPVGLATYLVSSLGEWSQEFQHLSINLQVHDDHIDLIEQRVDLAIRIGEMPDSSYVAHKIGTMRMGLYVTPGWIEENGMPSHPTDLKNCEWLHVQFNSAGLRQLHFFNEYEYLNFTVEMKPKFVINNILLLRKMCEQGYGICTLSEFEVEQSVKEQRLTRILPQWHLGETNIWAVTTHRKAQSAKVIQVIEHIKKQLILK